MKNKKFFDAIKALLPSGKAFNITQDGTLRRLFQAIAVLPEEIRSDMEKVYLDLFPETTRSPEMWEKAFLIVFTKNELEEYRRKVLEVLWAMNSRGQGVYYLEKLLQMLWPQIRVIENIPAANPRSSNVVYTAACNYRTMRCGNNRARCGYRIGSESFEPIVLRNDTGVGYDIPNDRRYWELCFYVAADAVRNSNREILYVEPLKIPRLYKNYIEYLILRLKPVHTTALLEVDWI